MWYILQKATEVKMPTDLCQVTGFRRKGSKATFCATYLVLPLATHKDLGISNGLIKFPISSDPRVLLTMFVNQ